METPGRDSPEHGTTNESSRSVADSDLANEAKNAARERMMSEAERQRSVASRALGDSARALEKAAESLTEDGQPVLARTTSSLASGLSEMAEKLGQSKPEDLVQEVSRFARQNPSLFIIGGVGAGLLLSRFFKATAETSGRDL